MTAHALTVLALALVCSPSITSLGQTEGASEHARARTAQEPTDARPATMLDSRTNTHIEPYFVELHNNHIANNRDRYILHELYLKKHYVINGIDQKSNDVNDDSHNELFDGYHKKVLKLNNNFDTSIKESKLEVRKEPTVSFVQSSEVRNNVVVPFYTLDKEAVLSNKASRRIYHRTNHFWRRKQEHIFVETNKAVSRVKRQDSATSEDKCEMFKHNVITGKIQHPHDIKGQNKNYYSNVECTTQIKVDDGNVIKLTFVDVFHIEDHPKCIYDYLEIRDGEHGYAKPLGRGKFCGEAFPQQITSTGPYMWLKFKSDDTIEYEGFTIKVEKVAHPASHKVPKECYMEVEIEHGTGEIDYEKIDEECKKKSEGHALDVLWIINTDPNTYIYLNFTEYQLTKPNECEENVVQVFGSELEDTPEKKLAHYCGSVANSVTTKQEGRKGDQERGNEMYVHLFASQAAVAAKLTKLKARVTAFKQLDPSTSEECPEEYGFNCQDNTCIDRMLACDSYAHCRLKADEDPETCKGEQEPIHKQEHIMAILVIFVLILSGMSFVFLFNCIRKLYQDHKIIKEHIRQSREDRLDAVLSDSRLMLDAARLQRASEPRASLERDNHANELFKQQRSISQHKQTSLDSDFQETHLDLDEEPWRRDVDHAPEPREHKAERNGKLRRDTSRKEDSIRSRKESTEVKKEIKDAAVGAPDTKESGCQTRESLFQADTAPSSDGSNSANSRGFSTFGYSGATLARPSPPAAPAPAPAPAPALSSTQIELLRQIPSQESKKKIPDRRPMSAETTRSAPDVIIVSKPIR